MQVYRGFSAAASKLDGCAVALGNFDGVHLGHQALFAEARRRARLRAGLAIAATFDPHPGKVLKPDLAPKLITPLWRKLELLEALGLDAVVLQPFDRAYASHTPADFLERDLFGCLSPHDVVVGPDFTFGKARGGTVEMLRQACAARQIGFSQLPAVTCEGVVVSSTKVREFVAEGRVDAAICLLGRPFDVCGRVVSGQGRGRTIGFPTANVEAETEVRPGLGVYAVRAFTELGMWGGAANLGRKPTFGELDVTLEVHLLDFEGDLYGRRMAVQFLERIRGEKRFASLGELKAQIDRDIVRTRAIVAAAEPPGPLAPFASGPPKAL
jgi:riboflavin kinase/FMN adenylyltransferase